MSQTAVAKSQTTGSVQEMLLIVHGCWTHHGVDYIAIFHTSLQSKAKIIFMFMLHDDNEDTKRSNGHTWLIKSGKLQALQATGNKGEGYLRRGCSRMDQLSLRCQEPIVGSIELFLHQEQQVRSPYDYQIGLLVSVSYASAMGSSLLHCQVQERKSIQLEFWQECPTSGCEANGKSFMMSSKKQQLTHLGRPCCEDLQSNNSIIF